MEPFFRLATAPHALLPCVPSLRELLVLFILLPVATAQVPDLRTYQWIRSTDQAAIGSLPEGFQYLPAGLTPEDVKDMEVQCVQMINSFRDGTRKFSDGTTDSNVVAGLRPLKLNCGMAPCSGSKAMGDLINNVAGGGGCAGAHSTAFVCKTPGSASLAQNSCCARGGGSWGDWDSSAYLTKDAILAELSSCLQDMWDEGITPGGQTGHWETMRSTVYSQVTCGFAWTTAGRIMMNQDFSSAPMWCDSCTCTTCGGNEPCSNKTCVCSAGVSSPPSSSSNTPAPTTRTPTQAPTPLPTKAPTKAPTPLPTKAPTPLPTNAPTPLSTKAPTPFPTPVPMTGAPTPFPSPAPTTNKPTLTPTPLPTTTMPTTKPSPSPTNFPSPAPTAQSNPTTPATGGKILPTANPTQQPTTPTTSKPTQKPTTSKPTRKPTKVPTSKPTQTPTTRKPTKSPTLKPTKKPTNVPTTRRPTLRPTTKTPTTRKPTNRPTMKPTKTPTQKPTVRTTTLAARAGCILPPVQNLQGTCSPGYLQDCAGKCWGPASTFLTSFGNGVCNDFESQGADFSCQTYCCDLGDCGTSCAGGLSARSLAAGTPNSLPGKYGLPLDMQPFTFTSFI